METDCHPGKICLVLVQIVHVLSNYDNRCIAVFFAKGPLPHGEMSPRQEECRPMQIPGGEPEAGEGRRIS